VVAIKSLVASALLSVCFAAAAAADNPTLKIDSADQAWAQHALLRSTDFGLGWRGGMTKPVKLEKPECPGFDPKESDLVITGHANASFDHADAGVHVGLDTQVLESAIAVQKDFERTMQPGLPACLAWQLKQGSGIVAVSVDPLDFPKLGASSAAYRATITVRSNGKTAKVISDYVFVGNGRLEYSLNVQAPARYRPQLVPFEANIARMLLKRGGKFE
jgi:hypothetical protein